MTEPCEDEEDTCTAGFFHFLKVSRQACVDMGYDPEIVNQLFFYGFCSAHWQVRVSPENKMEWQNSALMEEREWKEPLNKTMRKYFGRRKREITKKRLLSGTHDKDKEFMQNADGREEKQNVKKKKLDNSECV